MLGAKSIWRPFIGQLKFNNKFNNNLIIIRYQSQQKNDVIQSINDEQKTTNKAHQIDQLKEPKFGQIKTKFDKTAKLPAREPLVKGFFCGKADRELLAYPEAVTREDMNTLYKDVECRLQHLKETFDSTSVLTGKTINKQLLENLQQVNSFGTSVPSTFGGEGYNLTQQCYNIEAEAEDINVASVLCSHQLVTSVINDFGTDTQKNIYLPRLAKGEQVATVAMFEANAPSSGFFNTTSAEDLGSFYLNGEKSYVINASNSNLFIVLVQSKKSMESIDEITNCVTAFIVDGSLPGVHIHTDDLTIGCKGVPQSTVTFKNVQVNKEQILGVVDHGNVIAKRILLNSRMQSGLLSVVLAKKIIKTMTRFCLENKEFGEKLIDMELLQKKLSKAACSTYALESMIYLTAGLIDVYDDQDVELETAIIKAFSQESLMNTALTGLNFMGQNTLIEGQPIEIYLRNAIQLHANTEAYDSLSLLIGYMGLQYSGMHIHEIVKKVRNPLFNPAFIFKRLFDDNNIEHPKLTLNLSYELHQTLDHPAHWLEQSIIRLKIATETLLARHGTDILQKHMEVERLSQAAIYTYGIFATLSRSSRSYCIGLQHSNFEMLMASTFSYDAMKLIKNYVTEISQGTYYVNDTQMQKIAEQLFKFKGYFPAHPLTRVF